MNEPLRIGIIVGTTRVGRFADRPTQWFAEIAGKRAGVTFEVVDLRDYPMPFFDEPMSPMRAPVKNEVAQRWTKKMGELDGFVFVVGEYNHGYPAVLKNALDYVYAEMNRKPAAFVAYGGAGGLRAVEQLRLVLIEQQVAPIRTALHMDRPVLLGMLTEGKTFADYPELAPIAEAVLDDLLWWTKTLRAGRKETA